MTARSARMPLAWLILSMPALSVLACSAIAEDQSPAPAPGAAAPAADSSVEASDTTEPLPPPAVPAEPAVDPEVEAVLDRIERQAAQVKTFKATLRYDRVQGLLEDRQRRFGTLVYTAGPPARFAVHLDRLLVRVGEQWRQEQQNRWYIFDGRWMVERFDDEKVFRKTQVVAADVPAEQADPLALGSGPFAIPLSGRKQPVLDRFRVTLVKDARPPRDLPEGALHLRLEPRPGRRLDVTRIDLWYHPESLLPLRVHTLDDSENESIYDLTRHEINSPIDDKLIDTGEPKGAGWDVTITPLEP